ncbi:MAG: NADPH-dependent 7-cyano-7-deazaguanine reductase QueF [Thermomonas sp.]
MAVIEPVSRHSPEDSMLGREVAYPHQFDAGLLYPIARALGRDALTIPAGALPFVGIDRWHAYELSWLDARGKPQVATATLQVAADSPNLIESKSLKLYLNSCNAVRFDDADALRTQVETDLSTAAGAQVSMRFGLPPVQAGAGESIDALDIDIECYGPPDPCLLSANEGNIVEETLHSALLKSNCPVTGQPDWADLSITYRGPCIDRASLLRYVVSFRDHAGFHEQCVERIFIDLIARCQLQWLSVEARYTRRGGLDINPWRATPGLMAPPAGRCARQ